MKKLSVLLILTSLFVCSYSVAYADVYYAPQPTTVYVAPDPYYVAAQQLGSALGQISANIRLSSEQRKLQKLANDEADIIVGWLSQYSLEQIDQIIKQLTFDHGGTVYSQMQGNVYVARCNEIDNGAARFDEYVIDYNINKVRVIVEMSPPGIRVVSVKSF